MRKPLILLLTAIVMASCSNPNARYVKKAIHIMDKHGIYAQGPEWEKAKAEALAAKPSSLEEAQEIVMQAGKVAGGKHTYLMTADEVTENDTFSWEMPTVEMLENHIAFIKLPAFSGNAEDGIKYANTVRRRLVFEVKCFEGETLVGEGLHERFVVESEKFMSKFQ